MKLKSFKMYGQSSQDGEPSIDNPKEIISKEVSEIRVSGNDVQEQLIALSQPISLRGIPVKIDGNITINGQQYISDIICEKDGVIGIERNCCEEILDDKTTIKTVSKPDWAQVINCSLWDVMLKNIHSKHGSDKHSKMNILKNKYTNNDTEHFYVTDRAEANISLFILDSRLKTVDVQGAKEWLAQNKPNIVYQLETPTFEPLPYVDQEAIKSLTSYYPTTNIYVDAYSEVEYIADTKTYIDNKITSISTALMKGV